MRINKDYELSQNFGAMTVDQAVDLSQKQNMTLIDYFLSIEAGKNKFEIGLPETKQGLIKTGDEYATPTQFAVSGYELFDLTPNLPLSKFFHQGIVPVRVGGGFAETISALRLTYAMAKKRLAGGNTNEIETVDATPSKISVPAYTFTMGIVQATVDLLKSAQVAYDVLGYKLEALRLSYQRELDYFAFLGNEGIGGINKTDNAALFKGGLLNSTEIGEQAVTSDWLDWGVEDFVTNLVGVVTYLTVLNRWATDIIPDTIVFPPELWAILAKPAVVGSVGSSNGTGVVVSNMQYVSEQLRLRTGRAFDFKELPYISINADANYTTAGIVAKGTGGAGQIIFLKNSDRVFRMPIAMPLVGGALQPSPTEGGYRQNFLAVVGCPLFVYPTGIYKLYNVQKTFNVTYNLDSGTNSESNPATFVATDLPITLADPTRSGYVFNGWFTDSGKTIEIEQFTARQDYTVYAKWTAE